MQWKMASPKRWIKNFASVTLQLHQLHSFTWLPGLFSWRDAIPPFFSLSPVRRQVQVNLYRDLQAVQLGNKNTVSWADPKHLQSIRQTSWRSRGFALQNRLSFFWFGDFRSLRKLRLLLFFILFWGFKGRFQWRIDIVFYTFSIGL